MKKIYVIGLVICSVLLITLTGCGRVEQKDINDKLNTELKYVEDLIFKIANKYAKDEYLENSEMNWNDIKEEVLKINDSWGTLVLDLTKVNVSSDNILSFSNDLNDVMISISNKDDITMLDKLNKMYSEVIIYKQSYSTDKNEIEKSKIKNEILAVYTLANKNDYESAQKGISDLIEKYKGLMNDINYANENEYNLNKIYILLEEYRNSIQTKNLDLVKIKYISAVEEV